MLNLGFFLRFFVNQAPGGCSIFYAISHSCVEKICDWTIFIGNEEQRKIKYRMLNNVTDWTT